MYKIIVYIAHPISGDIDANLKDLARILRVINTNSNENYNFSNIVPVAPYYADIVALDDNNPLERKRGIENDIALINSGVFEELWLTGNEISFGMREEIKLFKLLGKNILDFTNKL